MGTFLMHVFYFVGVISASVVFGILLHWLMSRTRLTSWLLSPKQKRVVNLEKESQLMRCEAEALDASEKIKTCSTLAQAKRAKSDVAWRSRDGLAVGR